MGCRLISGEICLLPGKWTLEQLPRPPCITLRRAALAFRSVRIRILTVNGRLFFAAGPWIVFFRLNGIILLFHAVDAGDAADAADGGDAGDGDEQRQCCMLD